MSIDEEITSFAVRHDGHIVSVIPLLDELTRTHAELTAEELVAQVDAAIDRLYQARRLAFAGHRWLSESPVSVAGYLTGRLRELRFDATTHTWSWSGTAWTANITVR